MLGVQTRAAMSRIAASLVAGLGLFFLGLHLVGGHLKQASSRHFRRLITRVTDRFWRGSLLGLLAGVFMQSTSAVVVILASMVASGLVSVRRALPIVTWTNVGATLIVFVGVFDLEILVLYCLGLSATVFAFSGEVRWRPLCGVLLGICLLFFGIHLMKTRAADMQSFGWFDAIVNHAHGSYVLVFAAGTVLSFLTQSTTAVALLAVTLAHAGLVQVEETMMMVYGGNLGSTFSRMILSSGLKGSSRQIGRFQDLFKISGTLLFVLLFCLEFYGGVPLVKALCGALSDQLETQTAFTNLFCNLFPAFIFSPLLGPTQRLLDHYWPATLAEDIAQLKYLHPQALSDPETAIDLIEKEQARLVVRLPDQVNAMRPTDNGKRRIDRRGIHQAFQALFNEVQSYLTGLLHMPLPRATSERVTNVHDRQEVIGFLEETVHQMVHGVEETPPSEQLAALVQNMTEALDFLLTTAGDAATTLDCADADLLAGLCMDRGDLMGRIRTLYLASEQGLRPQDKLLLLGLTTHFDRVVWLMRRLAGLLQQNRQFRP
jgi:phosphate:Na+ symporter